MDDNGPADIITVQGSEQQLLLAIRADGRVEAPSLEAASEAGRVFVDSVRQYLAENPFPPLPMVLYCPQCFAQHIDEATETWANPPHRSHLCHNCGCIWRPADVPTVGVRAVATRGSADTVPEPMQRGFLHARVLSTRWGVGLAFIDLDDEEDREVLRLQLWAPLCEDGDNAKVAISIGLPGSASMEAHDVMSAANRAALIEMTPQRFEAALETAGIAPTLDAAFAKQEGTTDGN